MNAQTPFFSVIMPVYNGHPHVSEAIESVLGQTFGDWELIVADDQSTDSTPDIVKGFQAKHPEARITYLRMPEKNGINPARVRNYAIARAKGLWVSFLDHDDRWAPDKLLRHHEAALADGSVGLIHNDEYVFTDRGVESRGRIASRPDVDPASLSGSCFETLFNGNIVGMSCTSIRRDVLDEVGAFDISMIGTEDYNLLLRVALRHPIRFLPEPLTYYRIHGANLSRDGILMNANIIKCLRKIAADHPDRIKAMKSVRLGERLSFLHTELADRLLESGKPGEAFGNYLSAARLLRFSPGAWFRALRAAVPALRAAGARNA